ncbi:hypothetical protein KI387_014335, partial [Taxus chinensis]
VNEEVVLTNWEANGSGVEVIAAVGVEEVCAMKATTELVGVVIGVGEVVLVAEVDSLT